MLSSFAAARPVKLVDSDAQGGHADGAPQVKGTYPVNEIREFVEGLVRLQIAIEQQPSGLRSLEAARPMSQADCPRWAN